MATRKKLTETKEGPDKAPRRGRRQLDDNPANEQAGNSYFADSSQRTDLEFFSSGSVLYDQSVLGGGYVLGRMSNVVGDKSTNKTGQMIEAVVNFKLAYPDGLIRYAETESAMDIGYAGAMGMPVDIVEWADFKKSKKTVKFAEDKEDEDVSDRTVEWVFEDLRRFLSRLKGKPGLYIVDSLDALSDRAEMEKADGDSGGYGMRKAKALHEMFRRLVGELERSRCALLIVSQVKDKINAVAFGETLYRTGGHAMDFYATQVVWLANVGTLKKTIAGVERKIGLLLKAKCKKNKVGLPLRECVFPLIFGYGIDDITANVEWLIDVGSTELLADVDMSKSGYKLRIASLRDSKDRNEIIEVRRKLNALVVREWARIEQGFLPKQRKY